MKKNTRTSAHLEARAHREHVVVCWRSKADDLVSFLTWSGGDRVRVFDRDRCDPRLGDTLPHFTTWADAWAHLASHPPLQPVQLAVPAARVAFRDLHIVTMTINEGETR